METRCTAPVLNPFTFKRPHYKMTIIPHGTSPYQFAWCAIHWGNFDDVMLSFDKNAMLLKIR